MLGIYTWDNPDFFCNHHRDFTPTIYILQNLSKEQADYCMAHMKLYADPKSGNVIKDAYDYEEFVQVLFNQ